MTRYKVTYNYFESGKKRIAIRILGSLRQGTRVAIDVNVAKTNFKS
jgi:hypothetical protein